MIPLLVFALVPLGALNHLNPRDAFMAHTEYVAATISACIRAEPVVCREVLEIDTSQMKPLGTACITAAAYRFLIDDIWYEIKT